LRISSKVAHVTYLSEIRATKFSKHVQNSSILFDPNERANAKQRRSPALFSRSADPEADVADGFAAEA
jgi:hypothetical protein